MRLVGKKLYRIGPLKCFKGGSSSGGGGGGGSGAHPSRERKIGVKQAAKEHKAQKQAQKNISSTPQGRSFGYVPSLSLIHI